MKYLQSISTIHKIIRTKGSVVIFDTLRTRASDDLIVQVARGLIVSVIAFVVDFGMLLIFKEIIGLHYLLAATLSFSLGVIISYYLSNKWVFSNRKLVNRHVEFTIFIIICVAGLVLSLAIIACMVQLLSIDYRLAKVVATIVVFFWNFIVRKRILY